MLIELQSALVAGSAAGGVVSAILAVGAWRDRSAPGAVPFGWLMVAAVGWCLLNIGWLTTSDPTVATGLFLLTHLTSGTVVGLWVVFAITYTGRQSWLTPARLAGLLLVPNIYAVLALSNPLHGLVTAETVLLTQAGQTQFVGRTGSVYLLQTGISALFVLSGYGLFGEFLLRSRNVYRKQTFIVLTAGLLTAGAHGLFVLGATPHPGLDITPLTFALNGLLIAVVLFRNDFASVTPLAGDVLVDELPDPLFVLDDDDRVIDFNAAAKSVLDEETPTGRPLTDTSPGLLDDIERGEVFAIGEPLSYYDPQTSPISDQHGTVRGRLVVLRDVTGQQRRQERLETLQTATQQFIETDQPDQIARLAVNFATRVLDQDAAAVFRLTDEGRFEPSAVSEILTEYVQSGALAVDPEENPDHSLRRAYDSGTKRVTAFGSDVGPLETALMVPLGHHGVLAVGSEDGTYTTEDQQYAEILARTTQVALEQAERERQLRESQSSVERRNEQIAFFNGVLRHSLRNAMLVIQGRADYLRERVDAEERTHVDSITEWCERLTEMSDTIGEINETVAASESERLEAMSLPRVVRDAVRAAVDGAGDVDVETAVDEGEWVQANRLAVKVVESIVRNAIEHNTNASPRVDIGTRDAGDWIQVRIADNGPGISDELKATMFQRSMSPDQTAGGFGLYFVSVMMELYGGKVWYEDNEPTGAVAILEFQRAGDGADESPASVPNGEAQSKSRDD